MTIDTLPTFSVAAPTRTDPSTFSERGDTIMTEMVALIPAMNTSIGQINTATAQVTTDAATASSAATTATTQATAAAASAASAVNAPGTTATSTTSAAIPTAIPTSVSLTIQTGKSIVAGQWMIVTATSSTNNWFIGQVTSYNSGTGALVLNALYAQGTGTFTAWSVALAAPAMTTVNNAIQTKSGAYTAVAQDKGSVFKVIGTWTFGFTAAATLGSGWYCYLEKDDSGTITLDPNSTETVNGKNTIAIGRAQRWMVYCDGSALYAWRVAGLVPYLKVSDQKSSGTAGGSSLSNDITQTRTFNTTEINTIPGASVSGNQITFTEPGDYECYIRCPAYGVNVHKAFLYNVTDSTYALVGSSAHAFNYSAGGVYGQTDSVVMGIITITASKTFSIRHLTSVAVGTYGLGMPTSSGQVEVYTEAIFKKVA
ncbi:hypothetical protein [Massilia sp. TS11]|uniref:hypothetical protein n=1 Tax=Massilia sp. TS11 TaxID=2908003 RepID=UPI001EDAE65F|nr:hypothetical protein [Massilia sp. TS11]MCG2585518.1 hypothetical protein [Massilia sp. TS11]